MMISNQEQLILLLRCLGCGVWLELLWVIYEQLRRMYIRRKLLCILSDCTVAALAGLCIFLFSLAVSGGELRPVMLAAFLTGAAVSHASFGRLLRLLMNVFFRLCRAISAAWERGLQKSGDLWRKIRKKVIFFYKKGLQIGYGWVYNRK